MPSYTVSIIGKDGTPGTITVNASNQQAAMENAKQGGNTPTGMAGSSGGGGGGTSGGGGGGGSTASGAYQTKNGPRTLEQMAQELKNVGYGGPTDSASILSTYGRTTGQSVQPIWAGGGTITSATPVGGVPPGMQTYANTEGAQQAIKNAMDQAYQVYLNAKLQLDNDTLAFNKATEAFNESITAAGVTGMFQGQPTQAAMQYYANTFGQWAQPTSGQQTLAGIKQQQDYQNQLASMYGQYYAPGQTPTSGMQTLQAQKQMADLYGQVYAGGQAPAGQTTLFAQQQAYQQQLDAQKQALAQWQAQQGAAQNYLTMMAGLRGPADWMQYQKVLGSTPQGITDLVRAAAGIGVPSTSRSTNSQVPSSCLNCVTCRPRTGQLENPACLAITDCASASRNPDSRNCAGVMRRAAGRCFVKSAAAAVSPFFKSERSVLACVRRCSRLGREGSLSVIVPPCVLAWDPQTGVHEGRAVRIIHH